MTTYECLDCHHQWTEAPADLEDVTDDDWAPIGLAELAALIRSGAHKPITPEILAVEGALPLFYRQRINSLFGESGGGKTWVALAAIAEVVRHLGRAMMVDYEDNPAGIAERLVNLGLTDDEIARVDYRNPTTGLVLGLVALEHELTEYDLVVIDSTGEAMAAGGTDSNADAEVALWFALVKKLSRLPGGPAVIVLDHVPKDKDAPTSYAIGSQRKRAAVTGAAYRVDTLIEPAKGKNGKLKLTVAKDRPGNRPKGSTAAEIDVISAEGTVELHVRISDAQAAAAAGARFRPTVLMERVSRYLEGVPAASGRAVERAVSGKTDGIRAALGVLVDEGYVTSTPAGYESVRPFREDAEPVDNVTAPPAPHRAPTAPRGAAKSVDEPPRPRAPGIHTPGARGAGRESDGAQGDQVTAPPVDNLDPAEPF